MHQKIKAPDIKDQTMHVIKRNLQILNYGDYPSQDWLEEAPAAFRLFPENIKKTEPGTILCAPQTNWLSKEWPHWSAFLQDLAMLYPQKKNTFSRF